MVRPPKSFCLATPPAKSSAFSTRGLSRSCSTDAGTTLIDWGISSMGVSVFVALRERLAR